MPTDGAPAVVGEVVVERRLRLGRGGRDGLERRRLVHAGVTERGGDPLDASAVSTVAGDAPASNGTTSEESMPWAVVSSTSRLKTRSKAMRVEVDRRGREDVVDGVGDVAPERLVVERGRLHRLQLEVGGDHRGSLLVEPPADLLAPPPGAQRSSAAASRAA